MKKDMPELERSFSHNPTDGNFGALPVQATP